MYCDDCGSVVEMDLESYIQEKEAKGAVLCKRCDNSFLKRIVREEAQLRTSHTISHI